MANGVTEGASYEIAYLLTAGHYSLQGIHVVTIGNVVESFETGDFSMYNWQFSGSANWTVVSTGAHTGTYCAKSGTIGSSSRTDLVITTEVLADGELSFFKKVSSENGYDKLYFYIDNVEKGNWSGEVAWSEETYAITTGTHTFKWSYQKDGSVNNGSDCAWVDDIKFPPTSVTLALAPVENLAAEVDGNTVNLTWDASPNATQYKVLREGVELTTQAGTAYTDNNVADGIYNYSVVAMDDNGHSSAASNVSVSVGTVDIEENNVVEFAIYPNPVSNTLYVNGGNADFDYEMFNGMGQVVAKGNANGNMEISVGGMAKGVYFLRLTNGTQVRMEKVVVK